jgi:primosomal protein N' (replication factor Y)
MSKFAGVAIEDAYLPFDVLFYEAPDFLDIEVGSRVLVPLGKNNRPKLAYVLKIVDKIPENLSKDQIKSVISVVEKNLFSKEIAKLLYFVSESFLISIHSLINKVYGTYAEGELIPIVSVVDTESFADFKNSLKSEDQKNIANIIFENFPISLYSLRNKSKTKIEYLKRFLREIEIKKLINIQYKPPYPSNKLLSINNEKLFEEMIHKKGIAKSIKEVLIRIKKNRALPYRDAIYKIINGLEIIEMLLKEGVIKEIEEEIPELAVKDENKRLIVNGGSLKERVLYISNIFKSALKEKGTVLVVANEIALIKTLSELYESFFPGIVFGNIGKEKSEIRRQLKLGKRIIISTPFSLFVDIPNLQFIIVEDASSKYHLPHEYLPFDTRIVAYKKSEYENVSLIFSTYSLDDVIYYFQKEKGFELSNIKDLKNQNKRIIDMRREPKSDALSPISSYLESKIRKALDSNKNVAIVLNRKPYSTFIVCGECGYVHRCPVCGSPLYFDKEVNLLICPICGHTEQPIEKCPRCGSLSILYLGYGIQKLSNSLKNVFRNTNLVIIEGGSEIIYDSKNFEKTIFLGTEAIFSHLNFENVGLLAFVSADTFLNGSEIYTTFEAFKYLRQGAFEIYPNDIFVETYEKENYIIENFKKDNEFNFLMVELSFREELGYPPFVFLYEFKLSTKNIQPIFMNDLSDAKIYGPVEKFSEGSKVYELSIRTQTYPQDLYKLFTDAFRKKIIGARVFPAPSIVNVNPKD